jgi:hypothetical protein
MSNSSAGTIGIPGTSDANDTGMPSNQLNSTINRKFPLRDDEVVKEKATHRFDTIRDSSTQEANVLDQVRSLQDKLFELEEQVNFKGSGFARQVHKTGNNYSSDSSDDSDLSETFDTRRRMLRKRYDLEMERLEIKYSKRRTKK